MTFSLLKETIDAIVGIDAFFVKSSFIFKTVSLSTLMKRPLFGPVVLPKLFSGLYDLFFARVISMFFMLVGLSIGLFQSGLLALHVST
jgi:hypothetical protein